jgi:hypothetical protein
VNRQTFTWKSSSKVEIFYRHYINYQQNNWDELFTGLEHAQNTRVHATTGLSHFMMTFGQIPRNMADILIQQNSTAVECVSEFVSRIQIMVTKAVASIEQDTNVEI